MRIGICAELFGGPQGLKHPPSWESIKEQALAAEAVGFDLIAIPDAFLYRLPDKTIGFWESVSVAAAMAEATTSIEIGHFTLNTPYRQPALIASIGRTLDEISGGRYRLGLGAGNTPDADYAAAGAPSDRRYSRFSEAIQIIHGLLRGEEVSFDGEHHSVERSQLVLEGPRPKGPPIVIGAFKPRMMRLAARYADQWGGHVAEGPPTVEAFRPMIEELERACEEVGRDPDTLSRSVDVLVDPLGRWAEFRPEAAGRAITGSSEEIADTILEFRELGIEEFRCETAGPLSTGAETIESMEEIVKLVHTD